MEEALIHVKIKGFKKEIVHQINHVRLHKKFYFPVELVGVRGRSRTDSFDRKNSKSQFKWKFKFPKLEQPVPKSIKFWYQFKKWLVNNQYQNVYDFKQMIVSKFKTSRCNQMRRCEAEDGANGHCGEKRQ